MFSFFTTSTATHTLRDDLPMVACFHCLAFAALARAWYVLWVRHVARRDRLRQMEEVMLVKDMQESKHEEEVTQQEETINPIAENNNALPSTSSPDNIATSSTSASSATFTPVDGAGMDIKPKKSGYFEMKPNVHIYAHPNRNDEMVATLRKMILEVVGQDCNDTWVLNDACLWRYLVARKMNIEGAKKQAINAITWRKFRRPWETRARELDVEAATGKVAVRGKDQWGRPVVVLDCTKENTYDLDGNMKLLGYVFERACRMMCNGVEKYVVVIRLGETSMYNISKMPGPKQTSETLKILMTVFAERLGHGIFYQPPAIFNLFLRIFRPLMDEHVFTKVVWVHGDVSDGSTNDRAMKEIIGGDWKKIIGEIGERGNPKCTPGYNHAIEWPKVIEEEKTLFSEEIIPGT